MIRRWAMPAIVGLAVILGVAGCYATRVRMRGSSALVPQELRTYFASRDYYAKSLVLGVDALGADGGANASGALWRLRVQAVESTNRATVLERLDLYSVVPPVGAREGHFMFAYGSRVESDSGRFWGSAYPIDHDLVLIRDAVSPYSAGSQESSAETQSAHLTIPYSVLLREIEAATAQKPAGSLAARRTQARVR